MSNLITHSFGNEKKSAPALKRRFGKSNASLAAGDITKAELKEYLNAKKKGESPEGDLETKFNDYIANGVSGGYLDDAEVRTLFSDHVKGQIQDGSAENLEKTIGLDSVIGDYVRRKGFKHDSFEAQVFEYIQAALTQKAEGKDPKTEPVSLNANERLEGFVDHLTDSDQGLIVRNANLEQLRTSNDPMMRLLHTVSRDLGLDTAINNTRKQLLAGESSGLTNRLGDRLPDLLKREEEILNEILTPDGDLIIAKKANGEVIKKVESLELSSDMKDILAGSDDQAALDNSPFVDEDKFDFREFFLTAQKLSVTGDQEDLDAHVAKGLSFVLAHHKAKLKEAENNEDPDAAKQANEDFKLVSNAILGKSLLPSRLAKIVRESANRVITSKDFRERAAAGDLQELSTSLVKDFHKELDDQRGLTGLPGMQSIYNGGEIQVINPDDFSTESFEVKYVESEEVPANMAEDNRELNPGAEVSLERVVDAYGRTVEKASDKVFSLVATKVTGKTNLVSKEDIEKLAHDSEKALNSSGEDRIKDTESAVDLIAAQLKAYKDKNAVRDFEDVQEALRTYVEATVKQKGNKTKNLWTEKDDNKKLIPTELASKVKDLANTILEDGKDEQAIKASITEVTTALTDENNGVIDSDTLNNMMSGKKGISRARDLLSSVRVKAEESESLSKTLDLDKMMQIFDGTDGKKLQRALEDLSYPGTKFSEIKDQPDSERFGEFTTLLFAKDSKGGVDESKRLTALVQLINTVKAEDKSSLTTHIVNKLKGSGVKKGDETGIALNLKEALDQRVEGVSMGNTNPLRSTEYYEAKNQLEDVTKQLNEAATGKGDATQADLLNLAQRKEDLETQIEGLESAAATASGENLDNPTLSDFIRTNVIEAQQRKLVLGETFDNMRRQLDQVRGHFTAVGLKYFGDAEAFSKTTKPAVDTIINTLDSADKDSADALDKVKEALADNPTASAMFEQAKSGIQINPLKAPEYKTEHPGDIIDRILSFLQSTIYSPVLSLFGANTDSSSDSTGAATKAAA